MRVTGRRRSPQGTEPSAAGDQPSVRLRDLSLPRLLPLWVAIGYVMFFVVRFYVVRDAFGGDSHAYWLTGHRDTLYVNAPTERDAYLYSPAFAQLIAPLTALPWHVFVGLWMALEFAVLLWLLAPLGWKLGIPVLMLCAAELVLGDINVFLALAAVAGFRYPQAWAFPLLTKLAPGLGPLWFLVRREWRPLWMAIGATAAIAAVSVAFAPGLWVDWFRFLTQHQGKGTLLFPVRALAAAGLTVYAARADRRWLLPWAMLLAAPVIHNAAVPTVLAAIPRLQRDRRPAQFSRFPAPNGPHAAEGPV